ncbi:MAG: hypothetical protein A2289_17570 [Deltaproteobacteria bacterium RIFOXYA12_FULL_58_15]|nr:MAG: hypothetical protein A2289_17570 [Deltaproteobacteria bacterium RIFOXYA12_FULL_58_15]
MTSCFCIALLLLAEPTLLEARGNPNAESTTPQDDQDDVDRGTGLLKGSQAYDAGKYDEAIMHYQDLIRAGLDNGFIHFNLGNAYLRAGRLGHAIASYRRAQSLLPRNSDVRANLQFAREAAKDANPPKQTSAVLRTLFFWHFSLSLYELLWLLTGANLIFWVLLLAKRMRRNSELLRWAVALFFIVLVAVGGSVGIRIVFPQRIAVINAYEVDVRSGISKDTVVRFKLHEGAEARVVDEQDGWVRIDLADGKQGWVEGQAVLVLDL